jgi:hypothetical protein
MRLWRGLYKICVLIAHQDAEDWSSCPGSPRQAAALLLLNSTRRQELKAKLELLQAAARRNRGRSHSLYGPGEQKNFDCRDDEDMKKVVRYNQNKTLLE